MRTSYCVPQSQLTQLCPSDILSFYKEELVGECNNYVHDRAAITRTSIQKALLDIVDDAVASVKNARDILEGTKERENRVQAMESWFLILFQDSLSDRRRLYLLLHQTMVGVSLE